MTYSSSNPPKGSYIKSVRNIQITLVAQAKDGSALAGNLSVVLPDHDNYQIACQNGALQIVPAAGGTANVLPAGSYLDACQNPRVLLGCDARRIDGTYVRASIDVTDLKDPDIENCDGILVDDNALDAALDQVKRLLPQHAEAIDAREQDIKSYMLGTYTPDRAAAGVGAPTAPAPVRAGGAPAAEQQAGTSSCTTSCIVLFVDVVISLLSYRAFSRAQLQAIAASEEVLAALRGMEQGVVEDLARQLMHPADVYSVAKAIAHAFTSLANPDLIKAIVVAAAEQLSWFDMVKFSAVLIAESVSLFTPAGPEVVLAKAVILAASLEGLGEDAYHVVQDCALS
ncbi:hypothetical protein ACFFTM_00710 [Pseudoduganella plicata]|uniref:Uncharacterized protein n=1 Tax=Pseudoduganella plicata TaxID=321984 RepID=A0A4P7BEK5_9BURK|nr:hypothetical protein [Pseudoduganella plicata]QBQ36552.1 hypothetical protein E1742_10560 [Pseudoduganella plicata]GGY74440.1 hypothetical protein GCM10007388_03570 [Pseudoduganella plicata]